MSQNKTNSINGAISATPHAAIESLRLDEPIEKNSQVEGVSRPGTEVGFGAADLLMNRAIGLTPAAKAESATAKRATNAGSLKA